MKLLKVISLLFLSSCGYHVVEDESPDFVSTITVPYVVGDSAGQLTAELVGQLSSEGFRCLPNDGNLVLKVVIIQNENERIGYRYEREHPSGKLTKHLLPVESRKNVTAEVTLINAATDEVLIGPSIVKADADFDYVLFDSIRDLSFISPGGHREKTIRFSLGQLDTVEGAQDDATLVVYRHLAAKIVDGIVNHIE